MVNVKVFADKQTGQKLHAPDLLMPGHKSMMKAFKGLYLKPTFERV